MEGVEHLPTALGFCDASGVGAGGVWIDLNGPGKNFFWRVQWPADIFSDLVTWDNPSGVITNLDFELAELLLQESCFTIDCLRHD